MKILPTYASLQISMAGSVNVASRLRLLSVIKIGVDIIIISKVIHRYKGFIAFSSEFNIYTRLFQISAVPVYFLIALH